MHQESTSLWRRDFPALQQASVSTQVESCKILNLLQSVSPAATAVNIFPDGELSRLRLFGFTGKK